MDYISRIEEWTDEYLRDMCVLAVGTCALLEESESDLSPFWSLIFDEVRKRGWGDLERMEDVEISARRPQ